MYTGFGQEDNTAVWMQELRSLGIDAHGQNYDPNVLYSSWTDNSPAYRGQFDLLYWDDGRDVGDPMTESQQFY